MIQTFFRRVGIGLGVLLAVALLVPPFFGRKLWEWTVQRTANHLQSQGVWMLTENGYQVVAAAYLPGEAFRTKPTSDQCVWVYLRSVSDVPYVVGVLERFGECAYVQFFDVKAGDEATIAAVLRVTRPKSLLVDQGTANKAAIDAIFQSGSVGYLRTQGVQFSADAFASLRNTPQLSKLALVATTYDATLLNSVTSAPSLKFLRVSESRWNSSDLTPLAPWPRGETLTIDASELPPGVDAWIGEMPLLTELALDIAPVGDFDPAVFARLPRLWLLDLSRSAFDDAWLQRFPVLPELTSLTLDRSSVTEEGLATIWPRLPKLEMISLHDTECDHDAVSALQAKYPNIEFRYSARR
ncbi:MAG TPA: hypothetical protein VGE52_04700 [Pirellulales bacterium]